MSQLFLRLHVWCSTLMSDAIRGTALDTAAVDHESPADCVGAPVHRRDDRGQATTEYALVMLGAAVVALLVVAWATAGGGAGKIGRLFDRVIDAVAGKI